MPEIKQVMKVTRSTENVQLTVGRKCLPILQRSSESEFQFLPKLKLGTTARRSVGSAYQISPQQLSLAKKGKNKVWRSTSLVQSMPELKQALKVTRSTENVQLTVGRKCLPILQRLPLNSEIPVHCQS